MAYNEAAIRKLIDCSPAEQLYDELRPSLGQDEKLEILPAYAEIGLGEYVDYADFNDPHLIQRMYDEGITNQWIAEHTFVFSNEMISTGKNRVRRGAYHPRNKTVTIYPRAIIHQEAPRLAEAIAGLECSSEVVLETDIQRHYSRKATRTMYHEIRHMLQEALDGSSTRSSEEKIEQLKVRSFSGAAAGAIAGLISVIMATRHETASPVEDIAGMTIVATTTILGAAAGALSKYVRRHVEYENDEHEKDARSVEELGENNPTVVLWPKKEYAVAQNKTNTIYSVNM